MYRYGTQYSTLPEVEPESRATVHDGGPNPLHLLRVRAPRGRGGDALRGAPPERWELDGLHFVLDRVIAGGEHVAWNESDDRAAAGGGVHLLAGYSISSFPEVRLCGQPAKRLRRPRCLFGDSIMCRLEVEHALANCSHLQLNWHRQARARPPARPPG